MAMQMLKQLEHYWKPHGDIDNPDLTQEGNWTLSYIMPAIYHVGEAMSPKREEG